MRIPSAPSDQSDIDPSGAIKLESLSAEKPLFTIFPGQPKQLVDRSNFPSERVLTVIRESQDVWFDQVCVSFTFSPHPASSSDYESAPQLQVAHTMDSTQGDHEMLFSSATGVPETLPEERKVYETPAVRSRHIDPNSSPRIPPGSPSRFTSVSKSGLITLGTPGDAETTTSDSEDDRPPNRQKSRPEIVANDDDVPTPGRTSAPAVATGSTVTTPPEPLDLDDAGVQKSSTPYQTAPQNGQADGQQDCLPDSLPAAFQETKLHTPARATYSKKNDRSTRGKKELVQDALMKRDAKLEADDSSAPVTAKRRGRKRAAESMEVEEAVEEEAPPTVKSKSRKRSKTVESDEVSTGTASVRRSTRTANTPKPKPAPRASRSTRKKEVDNLANESISNNTQYTFPDATSDAEEEEEDEAVPKTPAPSKSKRKAPSTAKRATKASTPSPASATRTSKEYTGPPPRIVFSNSTLSSSKPVAAFLRTHSGRIIDSPSDPACNFLVVAPGELKRTPKLTIAVALGRSVVEDTWLSESRAAGVILDPDAFVPASGPDDWGRSLPDAIAAGRAGRNAVLAGYTVYLTSALVAYLRKTPGQDEALTDACRAAGAVAILKKPPRHDRGDGELGVVLGHGDDKEVPPLAKTFWQVYETQVVAMSVLRGKLALTEEFRILGKATKGRKST